jgi:hypothetical protein
MLLHALPYESPSKNTFCALQVFLEFTQNEFTDTLPTEVGFLSDLQFLNLAHNAFSGTIPTEVGQLQRLRK